MKSRTVTPLAGDEGVLARLAPLRDPSRGGRAEDYLRRTVRRLVPQLQDLSPDVPTTGNNGHEARVKASELPPRMRQTLERLLAGQSEKEIAVGLGRSKHTVHVYVKALYRRYGVCSRGELLARWVQPL